MNAGSPLERARRHLATTTDSSPMSGLLAAALSMAIAGAAAATAVILAAGSAR